MKLMTEAKITQLIEITEDDQKKYLIFIDDEWKKITEDEYNAKIRGA